MGQMDGILEASDGMSDCKLVNSDVEKNLHETGLAVEYLAESHKAVAGLSEITSEVSTSSKKENAQKNIKKVEIQDEMQYVDQTKLDCLSTENVAEKNVNHKRKRWGEKKAAKPKDETQSMDQTNCILNMHLSDGNLGKGIDGKHTEKGGSSQLSEISVRKESSISGLLHDMENPLDFCKETVLLPDEVEVSSNRVSSEVVEERSEYVSSSMEVDLKFIPCESQLSNHPNQMAAENLKPENWPNEVNDEIIVYEGQCSAQSKSVFCTESQHSNHPNQLASENPNFENGFNKVNDETIVYEGVSSAQGRSIFSTCNVDVTRHLSSSNMNEAEFLFGEYPRVPLIRSIKRKLIVLDVNGLLANIIMPAPKDCREDTRILGRAIFKRPFCDDFLKFCFQNFDVGVWSSRSKRIIDRVVEFLLGDLTEKLLFCWDMSHSTQTGFSTLENVHKPLVFKELKRIWENDDPYLPWKSGDYDESNTLLLDDSPYKALLNPLHTAIFPNSFHYKDKNDNSLGPGGDLRVYLEGLLISDNVRKYVKQHPFGQSDINEASVSWGFYSGVLQTMSSRLQDNTPSPVPII